MSQGRREDQIVASQRHARIAAIGFAVLIALGLILDLVRCAP